jgi:AbrB family looped-hinge helix DNA binding protein
MATMALDRFGRVVIPKEVRDRHGWKPGVTLQVVDDGDGIRLSTGVAATEAPSRGLMVQDGRLVYDAAFTAPAGDAIAQALAEDRAERDQRLAGG